MNTSHLMQVPRATEGGNCQGFGLIGESDGIKGVAQDIGRVASRTCSVLIEGETGTGKEVVARAIHESGPRQRNAWVAVNCGAIPETLLEAELFGHVRGAFTGAVQARAGKFEIANRGTIFLDEIAEMPLSVQAKLLRVLQEREIERLGGNDRVRLDVRVIAASNAGLADRVRRGLFREDLFYRLNVFRISVPPLRERSGDMLLLARHFLKKFCDQDRCTVKSLGPAAVAMLRAHSWPGNIRELENVAESAVILAGTREVIEPSDIRISDGIEIAGEFGERAVPVTIPRAGLNYQRTVEDFEQSIITQTLARVRGNKTAAAELLGLKRTTLAARMRVLEGRLPRLVA